MASNPKHFYTPEEYLALERKASYKSEFSSGEIFAMSGASWEHNLIVTNLVATLSDKLENPECNICAGDMRVKTPDSTDYTYPDILVVCGPPKFEDTSVDTLLNPVLIIEVLSPTTETYDRTKKFENYRKIDSLQEYLLVAQNECRVTLFTKQTDGSWTFKEATSLNNTLRLTSIDCDLEMKRVYKRIEFPVEEEAP